MNTEEYQPTLDVSQLLRELQRLLLGQRRSDRLICRYLADLADGVVEWPTLTLAYGTPLEFIRATFGFSAKTARERIRIGRALRTLPALDAALTTGQVAYSGIREVTRVATPDTEQTWLEAAQRLSPHALERRVAAAGGRRAPARRRPRSQTGQASEPGHVNISVPSEVWALVLRAMHAMRAARGSELDDWQALAEVARSAIAHTESGRAESGLAESGLAESGLAESGLAESGRADSEISADGPQARNGDPVADSRPTVEGGPRDTTASHPSIATGFSLGYPGAVPEDPTELAAQHAPKTMHEVPVPHSGACDPPLAGNDDRRGHGGDQHAFSDGQGALDQHRRGDGRGPIAAASLAAASMASPTVNASDGDDPAHGLVPCRSDVRGKRLSADARLLFDLIATGGDWNLATLGVVTEMPHSRLAEAVVDLELSRLVRRDVMGFFTVNQAG